MGELDEIVAHETTDGGVHEMRVGRQSAHRLGDRRGTGDGDGRPPRVSVDRELHATIGRPDTGRCHRELHREARPGADLGAAGFARVDALTTQWIAAPAPPVVPPSIPPTPIVPPLIPPIVPAAERSPLLCSRSLAITAIGLRDGRVQLRGLTDVELPGTRVAVVTAGRVVARPTVGANGTFALSVQRPYGVAQADLSYLVTAGSARSEPAALVQPLRIDRVRKVGRGKVRVEALVRGAGTKSLRARVEQRIACGRTRTIAHPRVRAAGRTGGARRIIVTVTRPAQGQGTAAIRLRVGSRIVSLPLLVTP